MNLRPNSGRPTSVDRSLLERPLRKPEAESDFYFVEADDPETAVARIIELVKTRIPRCFGLDPICDVQVLCPMNRGGVGARSANVELQVALNPAGERKVERFGPSRLATRSCRSRTITTKRSTTANIGFVEDVEPEEGELTVSFDGRSVTTPCCSVVCYTPASPAASGLWFWLGRRRPSPSRCATSRGAALVKAGGMAKRGRLEALDVGRHPAMMAVAVLFGEQESTEQVNCTVSSMHQACPLHASNC